MEQKHYDVGILGVWFGWQLRQPCTYYHWKSTSKVWKDGADGHRPRLGAEDGG